MNESRLWCPDPAAAAQACAAQYPQTRAHTLEIADEICQHIFTFRDHWEMERVRTPVAFGAEVYSIDWALIPFGDPEWVYAMNRHTSFVNLAKAWLFTGNSVYADTFAALVDDWIRRVPLTEQSSTDTWRSLEAGLRAANWLRVLRLFHGSSILPAEIGEKAHAMCRALRIWLKPNGHLLLQSDSDDVDARDLLVSGALLFQDAALCPEGISSLCAENLWDLGPEQQAAYSALLSSAQPLRSSRMLPDSGNCMLRGGEGSYVHMHCGCLGSGHGHAALQCLGSDAQLRLHQAPCSREYNTLWEGSALTVQRTAEHFNWFVTALHLMPDACSAPMHAELLPVSKLCAGVTLPDAQAQAVRVTVGREECVVLLCHAEVISEVDLLSAGGYSGYGKVLLFDPAHPHGLCLAW